MNILLTGFEPWGNDKRNPSGEVARALGGHVLPVDYDAAGREIRRLIRRERPDAVVMLGLAPGRTKIGLEILALNIDHCEEGRWRRWRRPILPGPTIRATRLPVDRIYRRLKEARVPVAISHHAGTFICNHVFFVGLAATDAPCGFVHVPPFKALAFPRQLRAARLILEVLRSGPEATPRAPRRGPSRSASRR